MVLVFGGCDSFDERGGAKATNKAAAAVEAPAADMFEAAGVAAE
jgi:hypothetical protein